MALEKGFGREDADGMITALPPLSSEPVRMNEGAVAPDGSFLCGSMAYDQRRGAAAMWRLHPDGRSERLFGGLTISNGLAFTADGTRPISASPENGGTDNVVVGGTLYRHR